MFCFPFLLQNKMEEADGSWSGTSGRGGKLRSRSANVADESLLDSVHASNGRNHVKSGRHVLPPWVRCCTSAETNAS